MKIPTLYLSWNRKRFVERSLPALNSTSCTNILSRHTPHIYAWDNGSTDGSNDALKRESDFGWLEEYEPSPANAGMNVPLAAFIKRHADSKYVAKVDCDTIVEPMWLDILIEQMERHDLWACAAWHWRPKGPAGTFWDWAQDCMRDLGDVFLHDYTGGTAVVIRTDLFREYGLPYHGYPCGLGDLTLLFRRAAMDGKRIGWSKRTFARLLDLQYDNGPTTDDYPEYDAEIAKMRDAGNAWWTEHHGVEGVEAWVESQGGREYL